MFHPDFRLGAPHGRDLLAEIGIRPATVDEIAEDERAIRCPDRGAVYPEYGFASLSPESPAEHGLREAGPDEPWDPAPARRPAGRRWRRAWRD